MLSRVAGNIYWLGRYLERAENMARLMTTHDNLIMDLPDVDRATAWLPLVSINSTEKTFADHFDAPTERNVTTFLISNLDNPSSIMNSIDGIHYNLRSCRAILPTALYELVNELCRFVKKSTATPLGPSARRYFLQRLEHQLLAIAGAINGGMSYNQAYLFMRIGCFIERIDMTSRILDVRSAQLMSSGDSNTLTPYENREWVAVLKSLQAFQMYLAEVQHPVNGPDVLAYVLQNDEHPRAVHFCANRLSKFIQQLPENEALLERTLQMMSTISEANIQQLAENTEELHAYIDNLQIQLASIGNGITNQYFPPVVN